MLHPPFARTAALPPAVREAGADTGSRHSLQTVYRKTVQRCYTLVVGKYLQTDRPAGRSARARAEGEPFMELRSNIKMLNYARKYLLNDTDNILPFPVRPQKPPRTGRLPTLLPRAAGRGCACCRAGYAVPQPVRRRVRHPCLHRTAPRPCGERGMVRALFKPVLACDAQHVQKRDGHRHRHAGR